jgi:peptidoglycan/LPS O-acetylase OafA/YrhL
MAGIVLFGVFVATPAQAETLPTHLAAAALWVANWYSILADQSYVDMFAAPSPVDHFWSLSMEEQFYVGMSIGMVLLLRVTGRTRHIVTVLGVVAAASLAWTVHLTRTGAPLDRVYLGTDTRLTEILLGSILAVLVVRGILRPGPRAQRALGWSALAAYAVSLWLWHTVPLDSEAVWGSGGIAAYAGLTVLVILGVLSDRGPLAALLAWWPLAALGRISYGTYLYHWPIFLWLTEDRTGLDGTALFAVRVATTMALAVASYHLLEVPIRNGATLNLTRRARYLAMPVCTALVVVASVVVVRGNGVDQSITFADDGSTDAPPAGGTDAVLDLLVIADADAGPVTDHLVALGRRDDSVDVVDGGTFGCARLVHGSDGWRCPAWDDAWGALVDEHDPDAVLLFVEDWAPAEVDRLVDEAGGGTEAPATVVEQVLGHGFDLLTAEGAPITWAVGATPIDEIDARAALPFHLAMARLLQQRTDLDRSPWLPQRRTPMGRPYLEQISGIMLDGLETNRRRADDGSTRVMVVGDSTARAVGYGLERYAAEQGGAVVWNVAVGGCGIVQDGVTIDFEDGAERPPLPECIDAVATWPDNIEHFDPDLVLVLSGLRDAQDRDLEGDGTFAAIGTPALDEHLVDRFVAATDVLSAGGATVVWLSPPCVRLLAALGEEIDDEHFDPSHMAALRAVVDRAAAERPDVAEVYDLHAVLCPGGEFLESADGVDDLRPDGIHLSVDGSLWLAERLYGDLLADATPDRG